MFKYNWDEETGGLLLTSDVPVQGFSSEPRPVYYRELDLLGFDRYWDYPRDDSAPVMWAEANNYIYRGKTIAASKGGSCYHAPELELKPGYDSFGEMLEPVDIEGMVARNKGLLEALVQETIKKIYNIYVANKDDVDVFYVAFSGGKDSVVALDLVQRALPHNDFRVLFGDTRMELPDTYKVVEQVKNWCEGEGIQFLIARSKLTPDQTWKTFGPPAVTNRWCCSVHKTSPQIILLREITGKPDFTGMAFTGIRAAESQRRSEYDDVSTGKKHTGQISCHGILEWNSAELFLYIYTHHLVLNEAYKKGLARAGCLVCPNSMGRSEYIKHVCYPEETGKFLGYIAQTSGKTNYTAQEMDAFIDAAYWQRRSTGRELNFGQDCFDVNADHNPPMITVFRQNVGWEKWARTIGDLYRESENGYAIKYRDKLYKIEVDSEEGKTVFLLCNCSKSKDDVRFFYLFRSVIVKTLYCVACGACEAECKNQGIDMSNGITITDKCIHCQKCHDIHEHCLRYNSIRNKITEGRKMTGLDRYFSFGFREDWLKIFCKYEGGTEFWTSDGDGEVANKKKDAFRAFLFDAGLAVYDKSAAGDKYTKCKPTEFAKTIFKLGAGSTKAWALILCNLVYTPTYNWLVNNLKMEVDYSADSIMLLLADVMDNDMKGHGKKNVVDSLKIALARTPLGTAGLFADYVAEEKTGSMGKESITLNSVRRRAWSDPVAEVILYSLYKFAEACGEYYQFALSTLLDESIEREGVSPSLIFGLGREELRPILSGLAVNYPDYISASFTLNLDSITLRPAGEDITSEDVLKLF